MEDICSERSHCSGQLSNRNDTGPRSIIGESKIKLENNIKIDFDENCSTKVLRERAQLRNARKQLKKTGIKVGVLFSAMLKIFEARGKVEGF